MTHTHRTPLHPAIVVVAYNRPASLARLFGSLARLRIPNESQVPLVVSVDDGFAETVRVADEFHWPHGPKQVIARSHRLGLREHVLSCGDLSAEYGAVMVLEDDLYVSPDAYRYADAAVDYYDDSEKVAGISLYSYRIDEYLGLTFHPLEDGYDTFFMQTPSSSGQVWTARQWSRFRRWDAENPLLAGIHFPRKASTWSTERSWKKAFLGYLIDTDRYYVFPRVGLTTNCGDPGTHFHKEAINTAGRLLLGEPRWRFAAWNTDALRYDSWFEPHTETIERWWPGFGGHEVTIDFFGSKDLDGIDTPLLLSSKPCAAPEADFPMILLPFAHNLALSGQGEFFHLGRASDFKPLPARKWRRIFETSNGQIGREISAGILWDRVVRHVTRDAGDPRLVD
ncbi:MAG: glycosyl transferase family 2 [Actinobacteria bacterium]|nr:glycosyl transferase family 2 [Actinomycetota bacterium]